LIALALLLPARADAHRLDEYLQATRISVAADRVDLELDLSPGVSVADAVVADIDTDRDGRISDTEARAYGAGVLRATTLTVDGRSVPVRLKASTFPSPDDMRQGVGTIRLTAAAPVPGTAGRRQLAFANAFQPMTGVYLVNALVPTDSRVTIGAQHRDPLQRTFRLDYDVAGRGAWLGWSGLFVAMLALLAVRRHL
jgi:hypothetical protein